MALVLCVWEVSGKALLHGPKGVLLPGRDAVVLLRVCEGVLHPGLLIWVREVVLHPRRNAAVLLRGREEVQRHRVREGVLHGQIVLRVREALLHGPEGVLQEVVLLCRRVLLRVCEGVLRHCVPEVVLLCGPKGLVQEVVLLRGCEEVQWHCAQEGVLLRVRGAPLCGPKGVLQKVVLLRGRVLLRVREGVLRHRVPEVVLLHGPKVVRK